MKIKRGINHILAISLLLSMMNSIFGTEVILNSVEVKGTISFAGEEFSRYLAKATSDEFNTTSNVFIDPAVSSSNYSLTVNVEPGTTRPYYVGATFYSGTDRFAVAPKLVDVVDVEPAMSTLFDIAQNDIGTVHGDIMLPEGVEVASSRVTFYFDDFNSNLYFSEAGFKSLSAGQLSFDMPVAASENIRIIAYITLTTGQQHTFVIPAFSVAKDAIHNVEFEIVPAVTAGSVGGQFDLNGPVQITRYWSRINGPGGNISKYYYPDTGTNIIDWSLENMASSDTTKYKQWLWADFKSLGLNVQMAVDYNAFNPSETFYIRDNEHTTVDVIANQAFVEGQLNIVGNFPFDELTQVQVKLNSLKLGRSPAYVDLSTMTYSAMGLDVGEWGLRYAQFKLAKFNPGNSTFLRREIIEYLPYASFTDQKLTPGQPLQQNLNIAMGSVTVKVSVAGGQTLSTPRIVSPTHSTWCTFYNDQNTLIHRWKTNSYNNDQFNVLTGEVTFHGPDGLCKGLKAEALVAGSWTTFGYFDVEVISGVDVVIDIGGPTISVDIEPGFISDTEALLFTGVATDDTEVTSVTVNGINATLISTGNPADPNEVSFSVTLPLTKGVNSLVTIATDSSGKQGSDTRTVSYDSSVPVLRFTPDNGVEVIIPETSVTVVGTTSDDVDIESVTVNGVLVTLNNIGTASYSFSTTLLLDQCANNYPCSTDITVISTDTSGRVTSETHTLTLVDDQNDDSPPTLAVSLNDGMYTSSEQLTITGVVTDNVEVTSVVINNKSAILTLLNETSDPNDRAFSTTIMLTPGSNEITTVATDSSGNQTADTRTVIYDDTDPELSFTPVDGSVVINIASVTVEGTTFDSSGITSLVINGTTVALNDEGAGNYRFSHEVLLQQCGLLSCDTDLTVTATDSNGRSTSITQKVTLITNLSPEISSITISHDVISVNETVLAEANFSDPNIDDVHSVIWNWGDNSPVTECSSNDLNNCSVTNTSLSASHTYNTSGVYTVSVSVTDELGETDSIRYEHVVVFDQNGGFVTGGGRINSPEGAYIADELLTGTAKFRFVVKYKKGSVIPTGNTEFQFQVGNINFHTNSFQWLVINQSSATFAGEGTLNGNNGYTILLRVVDAILSEESDVDLINVIIKDPTGEIIYDSLQLIPINKGSIVVHSKGN